MPYCVQFVTIQLYVVEETGVPAENRRLIPGHWQYSHMPGRYFDGPVTGPLLQAQITVPSK